MSASTVRDQIASYFGGTYNTATHSYRTPQIPGLGVVRRSVPKHDDHADYYIGQPAGSSHGSMMIVWVHEDDTARIAVAGKTSGIRRAAHTCVLQVLIRSTAGYAEDADEFAHTLKDNIVTRLHADRTCGSKGFENGGFQIGEGPAGGSIKTTVNPATTSANLTKIALWVGFTAVEMVYA